MAEEVGFENGRISDSQHHVTFTLTLDRATWHTVVHHTLTSTYHFCGLTDVQTYVQTYGWTDRHQGRLY